MSYVKRLEAVAEQVEAIGDDAAGDLNDMEFDDAVNEINAAIQRAITLAGQIEPGEAVSG